MLRVNVGLSRKLSKDYNSAGYTINLEGEVTAAVSDADAVIEQVKELYDLAEEALAQQIERSAGEDAIGSRDEPSQERAPHGGNGQSASPKRGSQQEDEPATNKQVQYLLTLSKRQRFSTAQLEKRIEEVLGRRVGIYDLTKREAGKVIESLTENGAEQRQPSRA